MSRTRATIAFDLDNMVPGKPSSTVVRVMYRSEDGIMQAYGDTVPSAEAGYASGCIFIHNDGSAGSMLYVNDGDATTSNFEVLGTPNNFDVMAADATNFEDALAVHIPTAYAVGYGSASGDGPSPLIWGDCPLLDMMLDPTVGYYYFDDFMGQTIDPGATANNGGWTVTRATSGTIGSVIGVGGELHLSAGATTDDQGINAQLLNCCVKPTADKTIWFEARVQVSNIDNQVFVGLGSTQTAIITSGALDESSASLVGFFTDVNSATTKYGTITSKAGNNDTTEDIAVGLAATTWAKLGIKITGITQVEFFYDGVLVETGVTAASIADAVEMAFSLVCQSEDGSSTNTLKVDWVRMAQLR